MNKRIISQETKDKISKKLMGHPISDKVRRTLADKSTFKKGFTPWNKGKTWSKEMKNKISETNKRKGIEPILKNKFPCGEEHPNWKGGISRTYKTGYYSLEYREWRRKVFERDGFICVICGGGDYITAHHILSFAHYPEYRYELSNGITLCEDCHKKTDNYKGRGSKKWKV